MRTLRATLRLQFHRDFTLDDATRRVPYFAALGISHVYASPLFTARPGSLHGYDVLDPTRINPELGGEDALRRLVGALHEHDMGLVVDIVSNHMAVGGDGNPWWLDVLEWGEASPYAKFFDIQWRSHDPLLRGQLLVPFLRTDYAEVLRAGEIVLGYREDTGQFHVAHFEHRFPLTPASCARILRHAGHPALGALAVRFASLPRGGRGRHRAHVLRTELLELCQAPEIRAALQRGMDAYRVDGEEGFQRLHALLECQHYRLASWRTAADDINWRRFFDINELGGLRVERGEVFEATHAKLFELIAEGLIDGLRIDHVDGLANPRAYCRRLRRRVDRLRPGEHLPIYVEKILGAGEALPGDWGVDGTTGYEFMNQVSLLQHDPAGEAPLSAFWKQASGRNLDFEEESVQARQLMLQGSLAGDLESVAQGLLLIARQDLATRDLTLGSLRRALTALIMHFPVYRTYVGVCGRSAEDWRFFSMALEGAKQSLPEADWPLLAHLERWLGGQPLRELPRGPARKLRRKVLTRFQQLTAPAAAKAVEDTACYRSARLLSRNDVGFDPQHFCAPPEDFHALCRERAARFPDNLLATATHDHKRGEDTRARLAALSERAEWFVAEAGAWLGESAPLRGEVNGEPAPSPADELMLYQTLLASWPLTLDAEDTAGLHGYLERLLRWQEKAMREAKLHSAWSAPNGPYEEASRAFLRALLEGAEGQALRTRIAGAARKLSPAGALNGLAQCLLKMTTPGVPDLYQGCEFWDFSLVDPDNRQPVDFEARQASLVRDAALSDLLQQWRDGRIKQHLIARTLELRRRLPDLFRRGDYQPLRVRGAHAQRVLAFARRHETDWLLVVVPRLGAPLLAGRDSPLIPGERWRDTAVELPGALAGASLTALFSGRVLSPPLELREALADCPVEILHVQERNHE
ncbi:MAG TPA: malto-oligosyltrehalose synthase [Pseudomonas sp.]|nr:malto-oligosyltrehalose synthase [Pseudomonas sp.]